MGDAAFGFLVGFVLCLCTINTYTYTDKHVLQIVNTACASFGGVLEEQGTEVNRTNYRITCNSGQEIIVKKTPENSTHI